jgi:hypothetical protein
VRACVVLAAALTVLSAAAPASSKGQMPAGWILTRAADLELALGSYCFTDAEANPVWLRGQCHEAAPPETRTDLPRAVVPCGRRAVFEVVGLEKVSVLTLQVGARSYRLQPRSHWSGEQGTWYTARWRVHGHSGLLTLNVSGEQGRLAYHARLRIRHPGCR